MSMISKHFKNNILYYLIYLLFIIEVIISLRLKYLAPDESFTYNMIQHSFLNIINLTSQDVHPFLYYFISKIFTYDIQNIYLKICVLRIISELPYLILLIISNIYIKNKISKSVSVTFMFCIISMPLLVGNMYSIRMYGWATLFTIIVYLLFRHSYINNNIQTFLLISLFSILSAYTHYYALITIFILYLLFLILFIIKKRKLKYMLLSIVIDVIVYLPWLSILLKQTRKASNTFWTHELTFSNFIHIVLGSISPVYKLSIFYVFPLLFLIILSIFVFNKTIKIDKYNSIGMIVPILLILIGCIISIIMGHSVILVRYVTPAMSIFWLEISIIISNINNKYKILKYILLFLLLLIGSLSYIKTNRNNVHIINQFNQTLKIYNQHFKNSAVIYDDIGIMFGSSDYFKNNYTLDNKNNVYKKTLNNFKIMNTINLPRGYKNIYYIKSDNNYNKLIHQFNNKYKHSINKKIILPIESNLNIYKIK